MKEKVIHITNARYSGKYKINISFSDNTEKDINFEEFIKNAKNPMTLKYLNINEFKSFRLEYGDLIWGDYEMCFPLWDLYEGKI